MSNIINSTISQNAFWMVNKKLARYLQSNDAALLLADLVARREFFSGRNDLDEEGGFFTLSEALEEELNLTKEARQKLTKQLEMVGFLLVKKRGLPSKNYYYVQDDAIAKVLGGEIKKSNDFQWAEKPAQYKAEISPEYKAENNATNKNKENKKREEKEKFSQDDIYRKWLSEVPERPDFKSCYEELLVLFESLKTSGYSGNDISPSFKKKVLRRWERSKFPQRHEDWWDKAIGSTFSSGIELSVPEVKEEKGVKVTRIDGQITIDAALRMATDDSVIEEMMREYERIRSSGPREGVLDDK
jgi:hypothetical protein